MDYKNFQNLKLDYTIERLKLKYGEELSKFGYNLVNVIQYNDRYFYIEYKNTKGNDIRIWKDLQSGKVEADFINNFPLENEEMHYKHISIKKLFEVLGDIEKRDFAFEEWSKNYEPLLTNFGFTSNKDFVQYHIYDTRYFYKDFKKENAVVRIWYDNKLEKFSADLILNDKKYENLSIKELFSILNGDINEQRRIGKT